MLNKSRLKGCFSKETVFLVLVTGLLLWAVGFRPEYVGTDTKSYINVYLQHIYQYEPFFCWIARAMSALAIPHPYFFMSLALVNMLLIFILVRRLVVLTHHYIEWFAMCCLVGTFLLFSPFFFSIMVNVIRQGIAILALFIFYLTLISVNNSSLHRPRHAAYPGHLKSKIKKIISAIPFAIIAVGFHRTSLLAIIFSPFLFLTYRTLLCSMAIVALLYLSGLSEKIIHTLSSLTSLDVYAMVNNYGPVGYKSKSGVRWEFAIFTLMVGALFDLLSRYYFTKDHREIFRPLLKVYWVFVLPFFLLGFARFSDRYLLCGWLFLSPICAVFTGFFIKTYIQLPFSTLNRYNLSIVRLYAPLSFAALYFILKVQGFFAKIF